MQPESGEPVTGGLGLASTVWFALAGAGVASAIILLLSTSALAASSPVRLTLAGVALAAVAVSSTVGVAIGALAGWFGLIAAFSADIGSIGGPLDWLIQLLEGVEDIPGTALAEGLTWDWESFPDYLTALAKREYTIDLGAHLPHAALRAFFPPGSSAPLHASGIGKALLGAFDDAVSWCVLAIVLATFGAGPGVALLAIVGGGYVDQLGLGDAHAAALAREVAAGGGSPPEVTVGIRPEDLVPSPDGALSMQVSGIEELGVSRLVHGVIGGERVSVVTSSRGRHHRGCAPPVSRRRRPAHAAGRVGEGRAA